MPPSAAGKNDVKLTVSSSRAESTLSETTLGPSPLMSLPYSVRTIIWEFIFPPGAIIHVANMARYWPKKGDNNTDGQSLFRSSRCEKAHMVNGDNCHCDFQRFEYWLFDSSETDGLAMAILRTCRRIYDECLETAYANMILSFIEPANSSFSDPTLLLKSIGSRAASSIRHLGLTCDAVMIQDANEDFEEVQTEAFFNTILWAAEYGQLESLYLNFRTQSCPSVPYTRSWLAVGQVISYNNRHRFIDNIIICFDISGSSMPQPDFLDAVAGTIDGWSNSTLEHKYIDQRIDEKIRILHDTADDGSEGPWDYEGLIRFETYMKECRVAESGARTQIVVKVDLLN